VEGGRTWADTSARPGLLYPRGEDKHSFMGNKHRHVHQTHASIARRLKRAEGHLRHVIEMIEDQRPCLDLAQQLHAVERAIGQAKKTLIHDHVDHCLDSAANGRGKTTRRVVGEFKAISKYL
jgi:DNA-binding FrmR family transcriptional regulator